MAGRPCAPLVALVGVLLLVGGVSGASHGCRGGGHSAVGGGRGTAGAFVVAPILRNGNLVSQRSLSRGVVRMGFAGDHLVTYGACFRQVEGLEICGPRQVDVDVELGTGSLEKSALASEEVVEEKAGKRVGVVSKIGSGVVAALNRVLVGPDSEEVRANLEAFAKCHPGIGLAIEPRPTKRISDIDRLEKCLEKALGVNDIEDM